MESSLSSIRRNIFVEKFEHMVIATAARLIHIGDTFVIWKHVIDNLRVFMEHSNNLQMTINFTN